MFALLRRLVPLTTLVCLVVPALLSAATTPVVASPRPHAATTTPSSTERMMVLSLPTAGTHAALSHAIAGGALP